MQACITGTWTSKVPGSAILVWQPWHSSFAPLRRGMWAEWSKRTTGSKRCTGLYSGMVSWQPAQTSDLVGSCTSMTLSLSRVDFRIGAWHSTQATPASMCMPCGNV